jgi:hypothetical protein
MKSVAASAFLLVAVAITSYAAGLNQRVPVAPRLSGDDLVARLLGDPNVSKSKQDAARLFKQRYAEGYLDGVVDATQGRSWCSPARLKSHEVDDRVFAELKKRAHGSMPGNAAGYVLEQFDLKFPCP